MNIPDWSQSFEDYMRKTMEAVPLAGASVGLAKDGELVYHQGFGYRDIEEKAEITPDTIFGIGSVTKSFTCVALMQLQEGGKLSVHEPVVKYLPEFRLKDGQSVEDITIHHFMTHTSGIPALPALGYAMKRTMLGDPAVDELDYDIEQHEPIDTYEELMDYIASLDFELLGPPGSLFAYNNDCYALLGAIIERVSGKSYEQYVKEHILTPAGMTRSVFTPKEVVWFTNVSINYANRMTNGTREVYAAPIWWDAPAMRAAGFLKSTIRDMLRYTEIFRTGGMVGEQRILTADSVDQMVKPHVRETMNSFYGYGLMIHPDYHGLSLVEHSGGLKSISAEMFIAKETGLTGMILNNTGSAPSSEMLSRLVCSIQSLPIETPLYTYVDYDVPADRLPDYEGKYMAFAGMGSVSVAQENGNLVGRIKDGTLLPMRAIASDLFLIMFEGSETEVRFLRDSAGHVNAVTLGGLTMRKCKEARAEQG